MTERELLDRCHAAVLALQAEVARFTQENARLREAAKQAEKDRRDDMRAAAAEADRSARYPDEPYGTY